MSGRKFVECWYATTFRLPQPCSVAPTLAQAHLSASFRVADTEPGPKGGAVGVVVHGGGALVGHDQERNSHVRPPCRGPDPTAPSSDWHPFPHTEPRLHRRAAWPHVRPRVSLTRASLRPARAGARCASWRPTGSVFGHGRRDVWATVCRAVCMHLSEAGAAGVGATALGAARLRSVHGRADPSPLHLQHRMRRRCGAALVLPGSSAALAGRDMRVYVQSCFRDSVYLYVTSFQSGLFICGRALQRGRGPRGR